MFEVMLGQIDVYGDNSVYGLKIIIDFQNCDS